ncbi:MAG: transposase [Solirubrobacteraceae bacterium]
MTERLHLGAGVDLMFEDRPWRVVAFDGRHVALQAIDCDDEARRVAVTELAASPGLRPLAGAPGGGPSRAALVEGWSDEMLKQALWRRAHVLEVLLGHPAGEFADGPGRPEYDPARTTLMERRALKARELRAAGMRMGERTLERWCANYEAEGLLGLADARAASLRRTRQSPSPEVLQVLDELAAGRTHGSTAGAHILYDDLRRELRRRFPDRAIVGLRVSEGGAQALRLPGRTAFYRLLKHRYRGAFLAGEAANRRSAADKPRPTSAPLRATRSGEVAQIDSTILDVMALDRATGVMGRPEVTLAVDAFDRSIRSVRVAAQGTKAVDAALMVYDLLCPVPWREPWGEECAWNFQGVPERLVIDMSREALRGSRPAQSPFGRPQTVVCDRGRVYLSRTFFAACEQFGISIQPAPPRTPNYKGVVEQAFDNVNEQLLQRLPGYVGRGAHHRGRRIEREPMLFLDELEGLIIDWAVTAYHRRAHDGCRLPEAPQVAVTSNQMFEYSLARSGFLTVAPSPERLVACLPSKRVVLQDYGINLNRLRYYHPVIDVWRRRPSPWDEDSRAPVHPIHYDPRDLSRVWFYEPDTERWVALLRVGALHPDVPFNDAALAWVKQLLADDGLQRPDPEIVSQQLDAFLERQLSGQTAPAERKLVARMLDQARHAGELRSATPAVSTVSGSAGSDPEPPPAQQPAEQPNKPKRPKRTVPAPETDDGPDDRSWDDDDIEPLPLIDDDSFNAAR